MSEGYGAGDGARVLDALYSFLSTGVTKTTTVIVAQSGDNVWCRRNKLSYTSADAVDKGRALAFHEIRY